MCIRSINKQMYKSENKDIKWKGDGAGDEKE